MKLKLPVTKIELWQKLDKIYFDLQKPKADFLISFGTPFYSVCQKALFMGFVELLAPLVKFFNRDVFEGYIFV